MLWIDSHCHMNAPEFDGDRAQALERAKDVGVAWMITSAVDTAHFDALVSWSHEVRQPYALGVHPLWIQHMESVQEQRAYDKACLATLKQYLLKYCNDPYLVAVGEIGLDYFVPNIDKQRQWFLFIEQLKLAYQFKLPVILHMRRSADMLLKGLRQVGVRQGIVHAFNGSFQQARHLVDLGFKLGFGGAATFERAQNIRKLFQSLEDKDFVLETDSPDMPAYWIYKTKEERSQGLPQSRNEPSELLKIAQNLASVRGVCLEKLSQDTVANTVTALPKLKLILGS